MGFDGRQHSQGLSAQYFAEMLSLANISSTVSTVESYYKSSEMSGSGPSLTLESRRHPIGGNHAGGMRLEYTHLAVA